jgi:hypothetical protein
MTVASIKKKVTGKGGEWKISLEIRNKMKEIDGVIVRDKIPNGFSVMGEFQTIKPVIRKLADGTELVWRVGRIAPNDERILHYTIKALMPFTEKLLHSAHLYGKSGNKTVQTTSNTETIEGKGLDTRLRVVAK